MTPVFFYGLFMDENLLREKGFYPGSPIISYVNDYGLRIGDRATLVPAAGERSFGTVMELDDEEINLLYGDPSVADYKPEAITVFTLDNIAIPATVYNLPMEELSGQNSNYLKALIRISKKTGLPQEYIHRLETLESKV